MPNYSWRTGDVDWTTYRQQFPDTKRNLAPNYKMQARADKKHGEIVLYGIIGDTIFGEGVTASKFRGDLKALGSVDTLDIRINSEGGDVWDAKAIFNALVEHKAKKTMFIDGLAASAASLIAMAGHRIHMNTGAYFMIHNAWGFAIGNAAAMRKTASLLDDVSNGFVSTYAARTRQTPDKIRQMLDSETWMNSSESLAFGFADSISEDARMAAMTVQFPQIFNKLPPSLAKNRRTAVVHLDAIKAMREAAQK